MEKDFRLINDVYGDAYVNNKVLDNEINEEYIKKTDEYLEEMNDIFSEFWTEEEMNGISAFAYDDNDTTVFFDDDDPTASFD